MASGGGGGGGGATCAAAIFWLSRAKRVVAKHLPLRVGIGVSREAALRGLFDDGARTEVVGDGGSIVEYCGRAVAQRLPDEFQVDPGCAGVGGRVPGSR